MCTFLQRPHPTWRDIYSWGAVTMCHLDDMSFGKRCERLPGVFTQVAACPPCLPPLLLSLSRRTALTRLCGFFFFFFKFRKIVERDVDVRLPVADVEKLEALPDSLRGATGELPTLADLCPSPTDGEVGTGGWKGHF